MLAPRVAAAAEAGAPPAFLVLLAGPAVPGSELLSRQLSGLARVQGVPPESAADFDRLVDAGIAALATGGGPAEIESRLAAVAGELAAGRSDAERQTVTALATGLGRILAGFDRPLFRELLAYDPAPVLARLRLPVLAIYGERDLNVSAAQSAPALEAALARAGNADASVRTLPELNHLLQHAPTGNPAEYAQIEETMSEEVLDLVAEWIMERFAKPPQR
ncbi:MAG TPA: hypothetical protein VF100_10365, partial [Thermoanaerobaculia bacterium]